MGEVGVTGAGTVGNPAGGVGTGTATGGAASAATIYPYPGYAGTPGLAPDSTIVVTGSGRATMKVDLSNRAAAQRSAIAAALADAKGQATGVAGEAGVTLGGVLSVSVSSSEGYAIPMLGAATVPPAAPQAGTGNTGPTATPVQPTSTELFVSVTVEYSIS